MLRVFILARLLSLEHGRAICNDLKMLCFVLSMGIRRIKVQESVLKFEAIYNLWNLFKFHT